MIELKAATISTAVVLRIVSPEAATVKPVFFTKRTGGPAQLNAFRVFSIDERFDISLLCALRVDGDSVYKKMPSSLEFDRRATGICSVRGDSIVAIVCAIQKLRALVVIEHAESYIFVGMDLAHVKRKPVVEEILPPVKDVQSDRFLRAAALEAI